MLGGALLPWDGFFTNLLHATLIGPLRLVAYGLHKYFNGIIRKCAKEDRAARATSAKATDAKVEQK